MSATLRMESWRAYQKSLVPAEVAASAMFRVVTLLHRVCRHAQAINRLNRWRIIDNTLISIT